MSTGNKPPCSAHVQTRGLVYFARMLDKIRLFAAGELRPDFHAKIGDQEFTNYDGRCCRFLGVRHADLRQRVLEGGTDEEILDWCHARGRKPTDEEVEVWNAFMSKRGWRDAASEALEKNKQYNGLAHRADILTMFDFFDADEGRNSAPGSST